MADRPRGRGEPGLDEDLARAAWLGALAHRGIVEVLRAAEQDPTGRLAQQLDGPGVEHVALDFADLLLGGPGVPQRAYRQVLAGGLACYLRHLRPPDPWRALRTPPRLQPNRVDLLWTHPDGGVLIDEIKTGPTGRRGLQLSSTRAQVRRYLDRGVAVFGPSLVGLRLLSTDPPGTGWLCTPDGQVRSLAGTPYLRPRPARQPDDAAAPPRTVVTSQASPRPPPSEVPPPG